MINIVININEDDESKRQSSVNDLRDIRQEEVGPQPYIDDALIGNRIEIGRDFTIVIPAFNFLPLRYTRVTFFFATVDWNSTTKGHTYDFSPNREVRHRVTQDQIIARPFRPGDVATTWSQLWLRAESRWVPMPKSLEYTFIEPLSV